MRPGRKATGYVAGLMALLLVAGACAPSAVGTTPSSAKDQEIATLKTQLAALSRDETYWKQLTSLLTPLTLPTMTDHRAYMLPTGAIIALHFDDMDLGKSRNLNWVAFGVPGKYCQADQVRIEKEFGKGFTHFHDLKNDTHGGKAGTDGVWFVHTAVREFDAPWGHVTPGVDLGFMPTPAQAC